MASYVGDNSPQSNKKLASNAIMANENGFDDGKTLRSSFKVPSDPSPHHDLAELAIQRANAPKPLQTSGLGNLQPPRTVSKVRNWPI